MSNLQLESIDKENNLKNTNKSSIMKKPLFIVVEGVDRAGKNTIIKSIKEVFYNEKIEQIDFPQRSTEIGKIIDKHLKKELPLNSQTIHLLYSANRWEFCERIANRKNHIISSRYFYSGIAYTLAKEDIEDEEWCYFPDRGLPKPDIIFLIKSDINVTCKRPGFGEEVYDEEKFQKKCMDNFLQITKNEKNLIILDGNLSVAKTSEIVKGAIEKYM